MERFNLLKLLKKLREVNVPNEKIANVILNQEEKLLNLLANLDKEKLKMSIEIIEKYSSTDYDVFEAVSLLNDSKYYQETYKVLTNEYAIKAVQK